MNISSMGGLIAIPFQGFYCASKYALEAFSESLRVEVMPYGVKVALVEPGDFKTQITKKPRCCGSFLRSLGLRLQAECSR